MDREAERTSLPWYCSGLCGAPRSSLYVLLFLPLVTSSYGASGRGLAALALAPFAVALDRVSEIQARWKQFLVVGLLNAAIPFSLIAFAETNITASLAAILNSTSVLFLALVAAVWIGDPLTYRKISGVIMSVVGVAVLVGLDPLPLSGAVLLSVGASLVAALFYAIAGAYAKQTFSGVRPLTLAVSQWSGAELLLLLPAAATLPGEAPPLAAALSALGLALCGVRRWLSCSTSPSSLTLD